MKSIEIIVSSQDKKFKLHHIDNISFCKENLKERSKLWVDIDENLKKQTILGMGYSFDHTSCYNLLQLSEIERKKTLQRLVDPVKGIGMNLWRLCIGTPDFTGTPWYSYCDNPPPEKANSIEILKHINNTFSIEKDLELIIPIIKEAQEINPKIIFYSSPWSPPGWMKDSGTMLGGRLLPKYYEAYALYLIKYIEEYEKLDIPIKAITVQNEPLHDWNKMPTCKWNLKGTEERDFIKNYLGPMFKTYKIKAEIWCYDHNWDDIPFRAANYPSTIIKDKKAAKYVDGVAFHHYSALGWSSPKLMKKHRKNIPDIPFYFTEGSLFGLFGCLRLSRYLKYGSSSYSGWVLMLDTNGNPNNGPFKANDSIIQRKIPQNSVEYNSDFFLQGLFFKYIQHNSIVLETNKKKVRGFEVISCLNPDSTIVSILTHKFKKPRKCTIIWKNNLAVVELYPNSVTCIKWEV